MKAERRHELQENDLVHLLERGREYLATNGKHVVVIAIVVIAVGVGASTLFRSQSVAREELWRQRAEINIEKPEDATTQLGNLRKLVDSASDQAFVLFGLVDEANLALRFARQGASATPERELVDRARSAYEEILRRFSGNPVAFGAAHCGLATVEENLFVLDGDPARKENARKHLDVVIDNPALQATPFGKMALDRRNALDATFQKVVFLPPMTPEEAAIAAEEAAAAAATAAPSQPTSVPVTQLFNLPGGQTTSPPASGGQPPSPPPIEGQPVPEKKPETAPSTP